MLEQRHSKFHCGASTRQRLSKVPMCVEARAMGRWVARSHEASHTVIGTRTPQGTPQ
jgi:hypothetical protein